MCTVAGFRLWGMCFGMVAFWLNQQLGKPFPCPGKVGQTWARDIKSNKQLQDDYKHLLGRDAKKAFRMKWRQLKLEAAEKRAIKETKELHEDRTVGTYLPFKKVWDAEGSDDAGFQAPLMI